MRLLARVLREASEALQLISGSMRRLGPARPPRRVGIFYILQRGMPTNGLLGPHKPLICCFQRWLANFLLFRRASPREKRTAQAGGVQWVFILVS